MWVEHAAFRSRDRDAAINTSVVRYVIIQRATDREVGCRLGERQRRVDRAADLLRGAGEVDVQVIAGHFNRADDRNWFTLEAIPVDVVGEGVFTIRPRRDAFTGQLLAIIHQRFEVVFDAFKAVAISQAHQLSFTDAAGGVLSIQITDKQIRQTYVLADNAHQRFVQNAFGVQLDGGDADAFLVDLSRVRSVGAWDAAAHIAVVRDYY
ncbi:hypothetical protein D9M68_726950 [compost metagenome]